MSGRPKVDYDELVRLRAGGMLMRELAERFGCTKAAISRRLSRKVSRRNSARIQHKCMCGCELLTIRKYATRACYFRTVCAGEFVSWRAGQRRARKLVAIRFALEPQHIVHHVDKDQRHNELSNLWVFASHATHMSHHRGGLGKPIWRGDGGDLHVTQPPMPPSPQR